LEMSGFRMKAIVGVVSKKRGGAVHTAVEMLNAVRMEGDCLYGLGTSTTTAIARHLKDIDKCEIRSSAAVGHVLVRVLPTDRPQPIKTANATITFDGRIYSAEDREPDISVVERYMGEQPESGAAKFIAQCDGDYTFAVAVGDHVIAGRDPVGVRPLYYGENEQISAVSSERRALQIVGVSDIRSFPPGNVAILGQSGSKFVQLKTLQESRCSVKRWNWESAMRLLERLLTRSVEQRLRGLSRVAVAFSGGLDSSTIAFLAKKQGVSVDLVHASLENQDETEHAEAVADQLGLPIHVYCYGEGNVDETIVKVMRAAEKCDPLSVSIGIPVYWAAERAAALGLSIMLAGQGADELFGGYERYQRLHCRSGRDRAEQEMRKDVLNLHETNLERDLKICNSQNVELRLPFADYRTVKIALAMPLELKLDCEGNSLRKLILRKTAERIGVPKSAVWRPKKAMQYATGVSRLLTRRAKKEGTSLSEYLRKRYSQIDFGDG